MEDRSLAHGGRSSVETGLEEPSRNLLTETFDGWVMELFAVFDATDRLLHGFHPAPDKPCALPVPVEEVAEFCRYEIVPDDLNRYRGKQAGLTLGRISFSDRKIFVDDGIGVSYAQKRYAVAHGLGHAYLRGKSDPPPRYCTEARIPSGRDEFLADVFAAFLMLPPRETFAFVRDYIQRDPRHPVDHEKLMEELSGAAKYPYMRTITAYEYLRLLAAYAHYHRDETIERMRTMKSGSLPIADPAELLREPIAPKELYG